MKRLLLTLALVSMCAGAAFASSVDLSAGACPGGAGVSSSAGNLDCAGGASVDVYLTFMPAEAITDLVGVDGILDLVVSGDVTSTATFWDFETANPTGLTVSRMPPAAGCADYSNLWSAPSSGEARAAIAVNPNRVRLAATVYRTSNASVAANQKVFGFTLTVGTANAVEAGGTGTGCASDACLIAQTAVPISASNASVTLLQLSFLYGQVVSFNGSSLQPCLATPATRHTWGQLKSLYR